MVATCPHRIGLGAGEPARQVGEGVCRKRDIGPTADIATTGAPGVRIERGAHGITLRLSHVLLCARLSNLCVETVLVL